MIIHAAGDQQNTGVYLYLLRAAIFVLNGAIERAVGVFGSDADRARHGARARTAAGELRNIARYGAAMAAIGENEDAHAGFEFPPEIVKLVIDQLAIVQNPGLVHAIIVLFVAIGIADLAAVAGISEKEDVALR